MHVCCVFIKPFLILILISQTDTLGIKCKKSKVTHANWSAKKTRFGGVDYNEVQCGDLMMRREIQFWHTLHPAEFAVAVANV